MELPDRSNNDNYLGIGLVGSSKSVFSVPVATKLLFFTANMIMRLLFSQLRWSWEGEMAEQVKIPQNLLSLQRFSCFC